MRNTALWMIVELDQDEQEVDGAVYEEGSAGDKDRIIYVIYMWVSLGVFSIGYFLSLSYSSKPSHYSSLHISESTMPIIIK